MTFQTECTNKGRITTTSFRKPDFNESRELEGKTISDGLCEETV